MTRITKNSWTADDIARLIELAKAGATITRAAGALNRSRVSVQAKARKLGYPLIGIDKIREQLRRKPKGAR